MRQVFLFFILLLTLTASAVERKKLNFNADWRLQVGDVAEASKADYDDSAWQRVTLPYAFNGSEAFQKDIVDLTDTICWYRKTFTLTEQDLQGKVFIRTSSTSLIPSAGIARPSPSPNKTCKARCSLSLRVPDRGLMSI